MKLATITVAAVVGGAYLRFSTRGVIGAYRLGRDFERLVANPARYVPAFRAGYEFGRGDRVNPSA